MYMYMYMYMFKYSENKIHIHTASGQKGLRLQRVNAPEAHTEELVEVWVHDIEQSPQLLQSHSHSSLTLLEMVLLSTREWEAGREEHMHGLYTCNML